MELSGAEIISAFLEDEGVEHIFGYPGGAVLHIYDALFTTNKVKHILVRHEQAAVHAADGYARATGKTGVALVTSGPGMTNAVTGIATAHLDSIPLVILSGQVPTHLIGSDAFQEVDAIGISRPCVKHNFLVKDIYELAITLKKAFYVASSGRPGPVLIDIPMDLQIAEIDPPEISDMLKPSFLNPPKLKSRIHEFLAALEIAQRPLILVGRGVRASGAVSLFHQFLEKQQLQ